MRRRGTFLRLDHGFLDDPDHLALSRDALLLHICGLLYASKHLTDGVLDKNPRVVMQWAPHFVSDGVDLEPLAGELVAAGKWEDWPKHWLIVGFLNWNNSKAQVDEWREKERERKKSASQEQTPPDVQITDSPRALRDASTRKADGRSDGLTHLRQIRGTSQESA